MLFYLATLSSTKFLTKEVPKLSDDEYDPTIVTIMDAQYHNNFICKNYILKGLDNTLDGMNNLIKSAKALWKALDKKYKAKDANMKKFIVDKFLGFKMVDSITIMN